eukprot:TRINITY_DN8428_c5_g1_i1.p2 TRINITY_DN8428_c5_g1~~TRINITY_DN8428_c5_g1_i1.p2  ORF type:complete len:562 (+),score=214.72 TRINITY_DN8428_c5_g1_i1:74-1687(+)
MRSASPHSLMPRPAPSSLWRGAPAVSPTRLPAAAGPPAPPSSGGERGPIHITAEELINYAERQEALREASTALATTATATTSSTSAHSPSSRQVGSEASGVLLKELNAAAMRQKAENDYKEWLRAQKADASVVLPLRSPGSVALREPSPPAPPLPPAPALQLYAPPPAQPPPRNRMSAPPAEDPQLVAQREEAQQELERLRERLADEQRQREDAWREERGRLRQSVEQRDAELRQKRDALAAKEAAFAEEQDRRNEELQQRTLGTEGARRRTAQALEATLRREMRETVLERASGEAERVLEERYTREAQGELEREFDIFRRRMRDEMERSRAGMEEEVLQMLQASVEQRLERALRPNVAQRVRGAVAQQLRDAEVASHLLREELRAALGDRESAQAGLAAAREAAAAAEQRGREAVCEARGAAHAAAEELAAEQEQIQRWEEQRKLYPLLREVELDPAPWVRVTGAIDAERRGVAAAQAELAAARAELERVRTRAMCAVGTGSAARPPSAPLTRQGSARAASEGAFAAAAARAARHM